MLHRVSGRCLAGAALYLAAVATAAAASFSVSPVRTTLSAAKASDSLTVRNNGSEATVVQLEVNAWSQHEGRDVLAPTKELLATPPIFTLPPGGTQIVRVGMRRAPDAQRELTYRLILQEVPPPPKPGFQGLQVALRLSIPVFVNPPVPAAASLRWSARREGADKVVVSAFNEGNAHVQIAHFDLDAGGGSTRLQASAYLLPGQGRQWVTKLATIPAAGQPLRLFASTDQGDVKAEIAVDKP